MYLLRTDRPPGDRRYAAPQRWSPRSTAAGCGRQPREELAAHPIKDDGTVGPGELFFDPKTENRGDPDGMTIDEHGNLYFTGRGGVWAVDPAGKALGFIPVPEFCSNVTFGQEDGRTLYLTCSKKVYALEMKVRGGQFSRNGQ